MKGLHIEASQTQNCWRMRRESRPQSPALARMPDMFSMAPLETRRLRGDLIEVFKMFKGFDNIMLSLNDFFKLSSTTLIGHTLKIYKPQVHLDVRKFFSQDYRRM